MQATARVIDHLRVRVEEFIFEDRQLVVVQVELKLQRVIGHSATPLEEGHDLVEDVIRTIRSKAKLLLHGMKSLCYGDPSAFNREAFGNQEDHGGLSLACGDNIQTD